MDTKHTPGPWHIGMKPGPMVYGPYGEQVTSINVMLDAPENLANCRLIAAAPDMLAALEKILQCEKARAADLRHRKAWELVRFSEDRVAAAEAAIAKAKGG